MASTEPSRPAEGLSSCTLLLALFFLGLVGAGILATGIGEFRQRPDLVGFMCLYILGFWPLYTCGLILYVLIGRLRNQRSPMSDNPPKSLLIVNLVIMFPIFVVIALLPRRVLTPSWEELSWKLVAVLALVLPVVLLVISGLRALLVANVGKLLEKTADTDTPTAEGLERDRDSALGSPEVRETKPELPRRGTGGQYRS